MATTNLNIRTDKEVKEKVENICSNLGLNMTTAVNIFLRAVIRENGIPFELKIDEPTAITIAAIEEGKRIAKDSNIKGYNNIDELKKALKI